MTVSKGSSQTIAVVKPEPTDHELLHTIFRYIPQIAKERNLDRLIVLLADLGRDLITADRCTVWLIDEESETLWSKVAHGVDRIVISKTAGIAGRVAMTGEAIITNDPYNYECFDKEVDIKTGYKTRSILSLPIQDSEGKAIGVFQAVNKLTQSGDFSETDMEHLLLAATYTGKQLESALLQEEIEATQKEIIFTLAETGEMRSKETGNHVKRVAEYSKILGTKYGLDEIEVELLRTASPLHDIGKIAIPDGILLKPGKLTGDEREIMQSHAGLGYHMLEHSERRILKSAATIAHEHHEKWNGDGYPRQLDGEDIHVFGRITAVADVFDALGSDRCYKQAWKEDRIIKLFESERGKHFDPELTDAFLDNFQEFLDVRDTYRDEFPELDS
jgi:HD-GYP domain-containing protein (c-di-GMP phosphodiesterase class II)